MLIHKEDIEAWLYSMNIKQYSINQDLSVYIDENIDLSSHSLQEIPIQFDTVVGSFDCTNNKLTSLKGCPKIVIGDFICAENQLTNLKYCPTIIKGNLYCSTNLLTTLEGCCEEILFNFSCTDNKLTTLKYGPKKVGAHYDCGFNPIKNLKNFNCHIIDTFSHYTLTEDLHKIPELKKFYDEEPECQTVNILGADLKALLLYNQFVKTIPKENLTITKKKKI